MSCNDTPENTSAIDFVPMARPIGGVEADLHVQSHPMLLPEHGRACALWDVLALILVVIVVEIVMGYVLDLALSLGGSTDPRLTHVLLTMVRGGLLLVVVWVILRERGQSISSIGLCSERWWVTGLFGLAGAGAAYVAFLMTLGVMALLFPESFASMQKNPERIFESFPKMHPVFLCGMALFVGIYEEVIFRGFLLTRLRRGTGSIVVAVIVSTFLFAAPHAFTQQSATIAPICAIGLVWAALTLWRRSVVPAIMAHGIFDLIQLMGLYFLHPQWE